MKIIQLTIEGMKPSDLPKIDACLGANPAIKNVALFDFTGDSAVIKISVRDSFNTVRVEKELSDGLRERLGEDPTIELEIHQESARA